MVYLLLSDLPNFILLALDFIRLKIIARLWVDKINQTTTTLSNEGEKGRNNKQPQNKGCYNVSPSIHQLVNICKYIQLSLFTWKMNREPSWNWVSVGGGDKTETDQLKSHLSIVRYDDATNWKLVSKLVELSLLTLTADVCHLRRCRLRKKRDNFLMPPHKQRNANKNNLERSGIWMKRRTSKEEYEWAARFILIALFNNGFIKVSFCSERWRKICFIKGDVVAAKCHYVVAFRGAICELNPNPNFASPQRLFSRWLASALISKGSKKYPSMLNRCNQKLSTFARSFQS